MWRTRLALVIALGCELLFGGTLLFAAWKPTTFPPSTRRYDHTATLLPSGKVLVVGGSEFSREVPIGNIIHFSIFAGAEIYDPLTGSWTTVAPLSTPRTAHTATLLPSGKVLVVGGTSMIGTQAFDPATTEIFDPATGSWELTGSLHTPRSSHTATLLPSGQVLVVGGKNLSQASIASAEVYDPATGQWSQVSWGPGESPLARALHTATLLPSGQVLVAGGFNATGQPIAQVELYQPGPGSWHLAGSPVPLSKARARHTATLLPSGQILIAGGQQTTDEMLQGAIATELYRPLASESAGAITRWGHTATLLPSGKVLVSGGWGPPSTDNGRALDSAQIFDPVSKTWTGAGTFSSPSRQHTATLLASGGVLVIGGRRDNFSMSNLTDIYFDPASIGREFDESFPPFPALDPPLVTLKSGQVLAVLSPTAFLFDEATGIWMPTSGYPPLGSPGPTATLLLTGDVLTGSLLFHPATGVWTAAAPLHTARDSHTTTLLPSGKVLAVGGNGANGPLASAEIHDPATGLWEETGGLATGRSRHTATLLASGKLLVAGGGNGTPLASAEIYDPDRGTWEPTGNLLQAREGHRAVLLPSGKVLVVGGSPPADASAEIYDPVLGTWQKAATPPTRRDSHTATLLPSGKVLVTGGNNPNLREETLSSVELYDPSNDTWESAPSLFLSRSAHGSVLLPSGRVLLLGGNGSDSSHELLRTNFEIYDHKPYLFPEGRQRPVITSTSTAIQYGQNFEILGTGFRGDSEASSGTAQNSAANFPLVELRSLDGQFLTSLSADFEDSTVLEVSDLPPTLHPGPHLLSVIAAGVPSKPFLVEVACEVVITDQPDSQTVSLGSTVLLKVVDQGGRRYQWHKDGVDIPGATGSTYTTPPLAAADSGSRYTVSVRSCKEVLSEPAVVTLADSIPPVASVVSPAGGEYWLLSSQSPAEPNQEVVAWTMSDNIRICRVVVRLLFSNDGGTTYQPIPGGPLLEDGPGGTCRFNEQPDDTSLIYKIPSAPPSGTPGSLYKVEVTVTDHTGLTKTARSQNPFFIVQSNPDAVDTLVLSHLSRMKAVQGISEDQRQRLETSLRDLANHPRVQGVLVDLANVTSLQSLYAAWDAAPGDAARVNGLLFGEGGIRDYLRDEVLPIYTGVKYVVLVGNDQIIPFARMADLTTFAEKRYIEGGDLTSQSTVGAALNSGFYLSDDLLAVKSPAKPSDLQADRGAFLPDLSIGRLVESPDEIISTIAKFISRDGLLDLQALHPETSHKVLITGYDFLLDSGRKIRSRWKNALGVPLPHEDGDLAPADGSLLTQDWDRASVEERRIQLKARLAGHGGPPYAILNLNGHATHDQEGVPGTDPKDIQGLSAEEIYSSLTFDGSVIYAVGCHGGLSVPGNDPEERRLDLPQTFLARGALAYIANTGYGWGLVEGVGYGERLVEIFTEELTAGGTAVVGDAVRRSKLRYFLELPRFDPYDEKTLLQWTTFGLPMYTVRTGIGAKLAASATVKILDTPPETAETESIDGVTVERRLSPKAALPPFLTQVNAHFDFSAEGVYTKFSALGDPVSGSGCPGPSGCYYTLNGLATGTSDLPIQPYFVYDSRLSGTSQHGALWLGGSYVEEKSWIPVTAELASNGGDFSNHGATPRMIMPHPRPRRRPTGEDETCRANDLELSSLVMVTGQAISEEQGATRSWSQRLQQDIDLELLYFNDQGLGGNCDREGPVLGASPFGESYHQVSGSTVEWAVPASDDGGVWRVIVVYDKGPDSEGRGSWLPLELVDDGNGVWRASLQIEDAPQLTYFLQAVDNRGNVTWQELETEVPPSSGVDHDLPEPVDVTFDRGLADLWLQMTDSPNPVPAGGLLHYILVVGNDGPDPASSLVVTDTLPAGATFAGAVGHWTCSENAGTARCALASLAAGASSTLQLLLQAPPNAGLVVNQASVSAFETDPVSSDNSDSEETSIVPGADLTVTQLASGSHAILGQPLTFTLTVQNRGPMDVLGAVVTDFFPAMLRPVSWTCTASPGAFCGSSGTERIADSVNLPSGGTVVYTAIANVAQNATGTITVSAALVMPPGLADPVPANNVSAVTLEVVNSTVIFKDGFESGNTSEWSATEPPP